MGRIDKEELMQILELILEEDKIRMCWLLISDTSATQCFGKDFTYLFEASKGLPLGDSASGIFFEIVFKNALRDLHSELKNNSNNERRYSNVTFFPAEIAYANDIEFPTQSQVKSNEIKTKINNGKIR